MDSAHPKSVLPGNAVLRLPELAGELAALDRLVRVPCYEGEERRKEQDDEAVECDGELRCEHGFLFRVYGGCNHVQIAL